MKLGGGTAVEGAGSPPSGGLALGSPSGGLPGKENGYGATRGCDPVA